MCVCVCVDNYSTSTHLPLECVYNCCVWIDINYWVAKATAMVEYVLLDALRKK